MSLEEDGRSSNSEEVSEKLDGVRKRPEYSYPREFLLSFSDLDICKKLPNGFDESLLSEFEDAGKSIPYHPRIPGSQPLQGLRKNQYGSSLPTREDSGNYSSGPYGKWEGSSSGRSDRECESQSDRDSDSGRRYGHPSQQPWHSTVQQDGLLGSGSLPRRPSEHVSGIYTLKSRANEDYQLNKSNEPYHPPRPYKAVPYSRRDKDSYNDETFGSMECNNEDRAEEERRRRASFEMIRKEQRKALQEKHNSALFPNISEVLEDKKEEMEPSSGTKELEASAATVVSSTNVDRSVPLQAPASRPLFPPGFSSGILEKISGVSQTPLLEKQTLVTGESLLDPQVSLVQDNPSVGFDQRSSQEVNIVNGQSSERSSILDHGENTKSLYNSDAHVRKPGMEDQMVCAFSSLESSGNMDDPVIAGLNSDALEDKTVGDANNKFSTSILGKIFGGALSRNDGGSNSAEYCRIKPDDALSCNSAPSSKFAQWYSEEEAKPTDDILFGVPNELLSLLSSSNKDQCQVSDSEAANFRPDFPLELSNKLIFDLPPTANEVTDQTFVGMKEESISTVITCEDLEQSILTEHGVKSTSINPLSEGWNTTDLYTEQTSKHVDDRASLHLLSLFQKGSDVNGTSLNSDVGHNLNDKSLVSQEHDMNMVVHEHKHEENGRSVLNLGNTITLEALFGSAFMEELQSVEAPISVQRGSNEVDAPESLGLLLPAANNIVPSSETDLAGLQGLLASSDRPHVGSSKAEKWLGVDDSSNGTISSNDCLDEISKLGFGTVEFHPPLEADILSHRMVTFMPTHTSVNNVDSFLNGPGEMLGKLTGNAFKDDRALLSEKLPYTNLGCRLPYPARQQPLLQFQSPQMAPLRPLHNNFEAPLAHMSSQIEFLGPEHIPTHYSSVHHQFSSNVIQHSHHPPPNGHAGLDVRSLASMQHQMQLSGNQFHLVPEFQRGGPVNQAAGFILGTNQMQGFLPETRQPNIRSPGLPIPAPRLNSSGHNPPLELFQRQIELGVQANPRHVHPSSSGYSHGLDMGFQYRQLT